MDGTDPHSMGQLGAIVMETLSYLGMSQHNERFMRLIQAANVTSVQQFEALDEQDCEELRLPSDLVTSVQKRIKVWKLEMGDYVEQELEQGERFYSNPAAQPPPPAEEPARGRGRDGRDARGGRTPPGTPRAKSPAPSGVSTPRQQQTVTFAQEDAMALNNMVRDRLANQQQQVDSRKNNETLSKGFQKIDDVLNTRLLKIENLITQSMRKQEEPGTGQKSLQTDVQRMQQDIQRLRDTMVAQTEQMQHQQHVQQQVQSQNHRLQQQVEQLLQQSTSYHGEIMTAMQQAGSQTGAVASHRRIEDQLSKTMNKLDSLEAQAKQRSSDAASEVLKQQVPARFEKIESMLSALQCAAPQEAVHRRIEDQLSKTMNKMDAVEHKLHMDSNGVSESMRQMFQSMFDKIEAASIAQQQQQRRLEEWMDRLAQRVEGHAQQQNAMVPTQSVNGSPYMQNMQAAHHANGINGFSTSSYSSALNGVNGMGTMNGVSGGFMEGCANTEADRMKDSFSKSPFTQPATSYSQKGFEHDSMLQNRGGTNFIDSARQNLEGSSMTPKRPPSAPAKSRGMQRPFHAGFGGTQRHAEDRGNGHFPPVWTGA